jgi:glycosyltransferase involved in cell wall biosynthesis
MISVVIPARNCEATLERAVESVVEQENDDRLNPVEAIIVLNGCTDRTEEVATNLSRRQWPWRVRIERAAPGIVPALNVGLKCATGDIIFRQDADDVWSPGKLKKQTLFLRDNPDIDIVGTQLNVVDGLGRHLYDTTYPTDNRGICNNMLSGINALGHPSVAFRRSVLDRCAGYFDMFPLAEDLDLWLRAMKWHKFANINEPLVTYRHVPNPTYDPRIPQTVAAWYRLIYGVDK